MLSVTNDSETSQLNKVTQGKHKIKRAVLPLFFLDRFKIVTSDLREGLGAEIVLSQV